MTWTHLVDTLTPEVQAHLVTGTVTRLQGLSLDTLRDRGELQELAAQTLMQTATQQGVLLPADLRVQLMYQVVAMLGGLGFFNELLPPARTDLSEIVLTPEGDVWLLPKGARDFEHTALKPTLEESWRAVEALLAPQGRALSEATPTVDAKLPRLTGMGGARVKIIHPRLAPGRGYPSINVRLFEAEPVAPTQLLAWEMLPDSLLQTLLTLVKQEYRLLIIGGTNSGKTTLLSALGSGIPPEARVVKVEDPEEIWLAHPHVVTLEARPALPGVPHSAYTVKDAVDDALRMSPRWLLVGEVRKGEVAQALFRAQMSDHPGLSTFHAENPWQALRRMALLMQADAGVSEPAARQSFVSAIDVIVQVGWLAGRRQVVGVWAVERASSETEAVFTPLYVPEAHLDEDKRPPNLKLLFAGDLG
jgi:pilus assembly protein CpaF